MARLYDFIVGAETDVSPSVTSDFVTVSGAQSFTGAKTFRGVVDVNESPAISQISTAGTIAVDTLSGAEFIVHTNDFKLYACRVRLIKLLCNEFKTLKPIASNWCHQA